LFVIYLQLYAINIQLSTPILNLFSPLIFIESSSFSHKKVAFSSRFFS